MPKILYYMY
uniref:Uncharacterized protein n=1 Tax=Arundo donax TaxID=35708 RepID=A0A0A9BNS4_ARUDO